MPEYPDEMTKKKRLDYYNRIHLNSREDLMFKITDMFDRCVKIINRVYITIRQNSKLLS